MASSDMIAAPEPAATPHPFDAAASSYDAMFTDRPLGRWYRNQVWKRLAKSFSPGDHVLDLGCGTGEDAIWLAQRGVHVTAGDASTAMLDIARQKAAASQVDDVVTFTQLDLTTIDTSPLPVPDHSDHARQHSATMSEPTDAPMSFRPEFRGESRGTKRRNPSAHGIGSIAGTQGLVARRSDLSATRDHSECDRATVGMTATGDNDTSNGSGVRAAYDGAYSNFGPLNCLEDRRPLANALADAIRPGGRLVLVVMGPLCPWEMVWHTARFEFRTAFRRLRSGVRANIGDGDTLRVWYPSIRTLEADFDPHFRAVERFGLGLLVPPSAMNGLVQRTPRLFSKLAVIDKHFGHLEPWLWFNDHYLLVMERRAS